MIPHTEAPRRRGVLARVVHDEEGRPNGPLLLGTAALAMVFLALGTFLAMFVASTGEPEVLGFWIVVTFLAVKVPLLTVLWWVLIRGGDRPGTRRWSRSETAEILHYLEEQAAQSAGRPDAADRLTYFAGEARHVAQQSDGPQRDSALATARRIESMAGRVPVAPSGQPGDAG